MIITMEGPISLLRLLLLPILLLSFTLLTRPLITTLPPPPPLRFLNNLPLHNPRHHNILLPTLSPTPSTPLLLQRPDVHERFAAGFEVCEDGGYGFGAALAGREVVDDGDGDGEVEGRERVRQGEDVGDGDGVRLVGDGDGGEIGGSVGGVA